MNNMNIFLPIVIGIIVIIGTLLLLIVSRNNRIKRLRRSLIKLKQSFDRLDEQAKLIVKTDLELNKAQEESERRLRALEALQKTSRLISTTLDEKEIFHRLDQSLINELGFDRSLILVYDENNKMQSRVAHGIMAEEIPFVLDNLEKEISLISYLNEGNSLSSVSAPMQRREGIMRIFGLENFAASPILTQSGIIGYVFVGNRSHATPITQGDEELISILSNQIGQALENARLFEEVYHSQKDLEGRVQDRTKQLKNALDDVQAINKAKSEFISAVSHELRTPLTSIKGYAAILMAGKLGDVPQAVHQRLEKINTHSDNLVQLINNLLDISRIESGRTTMAIIKCHLQNIINNVTDLMTPQMKEKNINLACNVDPNIPEMMLDNSQVERIFINLIGNATKFTPENGMITVDAHMQDNETVKCSVEDTGIGIDDSDLKRLFEEFYRVENKINQNVKGTGLGLPLAKKIVEAHGGKMWATSTVGKGTTFHFTLPVEEEKNMTTEEK